MRFLIESLYEVGGGEWWKEEEEGLMEELEVEKSMIESSSLLLCGFKQDAMCRFLDHELVSLRRKNFVMKCSILEEIWKLKQPS